MDTNALEFNTAISQMMIFVNELYKTKALYKEVWEPFVLLLAPYAPHLTEEIWEKLGNKPSIANQAWPEWNEEMTKEDIVLVILQVNGKVRAKIELPVGLDQEALKEQAFANERIQEWIAGKTIIKVIAVPNKLVNIVVR